MVISLPYSKNPDNPDFLKRKKKKTRQHCSFTGEMVTGVMKGTFRVLPSGDIQSTINKKEEEVRLCSRGFTECLVIYMP